MRAVKKEPEALERVLDEIRRSNDARIRKYAASLEANVPEEHARLFAERLALALQASLLARFSLPEIADAFIASRLEGNHGHAFGTLKSIPDFE
jgi:putative acyl-CoA dehydrogenase